MEERQTHTIDAEDKAIGRISTEAAAVLRGKHKKDFAPNKDSGDFVLVKNLRKAKFSGKKLEQKKYQRHSGYPGGLKETPLIKVWEQEPHEVLKKAVWGMLPKNKLRKEQIKRLKSEL
jgi:large subunit ribosomal protein L13